MAEPPPDAELVQDASDAQLLALALAVLQEQRPGFAYAIGELAERLRIRPVLAAMIEARSGACPCCKQPVPIAPE
jgi:hypothetical protein